MECKFEVQPSMRNHRQYEGVTRKYGITVGGVNYIVKFSRKGLASAIYSEYVASNFIRNLGVNCQEVWWGWADGHMVNIIRDFKRPGESLRSYQDMDQSSLDTVKEGKQYTYEDVLYLLQHHKKADKEAALKQFWEQFICDAILGNRDRHAGNWGFLTTSDGRYRTAPIYDNGGSLFPDMGTKILEYPKDPYRFLCERAERFPASLFQVDGHRTNYYGICGKLPPIPLKDSLTLGRVFDAITEASFMTAEPYRSFYRQIVCMRYLHIIERMGLDEAFARVSDLTS